MKIYGYIACWMMLSCTQSKQSSEFDENGRQEVGQHGLVKQESERQSEFSALYTEAGVYLETEAFYKAEVIYQQLLALEDYDEMPNVGLGSVNMLRHDIEAAKGYYQKAIAINDSSYFGNLGLGSAYYELEKFDSAIVYYRRANRAALELAEPYWGLAFSYNRIKMIDSAAYFAKIFIELAPNSTYRLSMEALIAKSRQSEIFNR